MKRGVKNFHPAHALSLKQGGWRTLQRAAELPPPTHELSYFAFPHGFWKKIWQQKKMHLILTQTELSGFTET